MTDTDKILQALEALQEGQRALQSDVNTLKSGVTGLNGRMEALEGRMGGLEGRMDTLELKVEAFHSEQKKANEEIISLVANFSEADGAAQRELEQRVDRIEKHLDLPPVK